MSGKSSDTFSFISKRAVKSLSCENVLLEFFAKTAANPFNAETNPSGIINMGTSENKLVMDILNERFSKISLGNLPNQLMQYNDMHGTASFRSALAAFLTRYMKPVSPIDKDNLFVFNGCGSVIEMLGFAICDDGDCVLIPAPYYGAFQTDLATRMGCDVYSIELTHAVKAEYGETVPFELSIGRMEQAYKSAKSAGLNVRAIILANPNNPLGNVYTKAQLLSYLKFADKYKLHFILDEIYFLSIYDPDVSMTTGLSLSGAIDPNLLHIVWGFSKDFAVSGFRTGLVHTVNSELASVLFSSGYFQSVPTIAQYVLQCIVEDFDWLDTIYFPTNQERLKKAKNYVCSELDELGVQCLPSVGGLYVWVDFREFVQPLNKEGEMKLMERFLENGVYITAGLAFQAPEFGWFRIIFSVNDIQLKPGVQRIKKVLSEVKGKNTHVDNPRKNHGSEAEENLDDLVVKLQNQISSSDWLTHNTADKWVKDNPTLASKFLEEKNRK